MSLAPRLHGLPEEQIETLKLYDADKRLAMAKCLNVPPKEGGAPVPFELNFPQEKLHILWEKIRVYNRFKTKGRTDGPVKIICLKARQVGISTYVQGRSFLEAMWHANMSVAVVAHKEKAAINVLRKSRGFYNSWSRSERYLRYNFSGKGSKQELEWDSDSRLISQTAGSEDLARSYTYQIVHLSEKAFYKDMAGVNAMFGSVHDTATVIIESTANGAQGPFYQDWEKALTLEEVLEATENQDAKKLGAWNGYFKYFCGWWENPENTLELEAWEEQHIRDTINEREQEHAEAIKDEYDVELTPGQLAWRRKTIAQECQEQPGMEPDDYYDQEYPGTPDHAFVSQGTRFFVPQRTLIRMRNRAEQNRPRHNVRLYNNPIPQLVTPGRANFRIWETPKPGHSYSIGADPAEGLQSGDQSVACVLDRTDGTFAKEVACWAGKAHPQLFADILCILGEWFNTAYITHERNNHGHTVSARLLENRYWNLFFQHDKAKLQTADPVHSFVGMMSGQRSRLTHLGIVQREVFNSDVEFRDLEGMDEMLRFENIDGKVQAPAGENDDHVIARSLAIYGHKVGAPPVDRIELMTAAPDLVPADDYQNKIWWLLQNSPKIQKDARHNRKLFGHQPGFEARSGGPFGGSKVR